LPLPYPLWFESLLPMNDLEKLKDSLSIVKSEDEKLEILLTLASYFKIEDANQSLLYLVEAESIARQLSNKGDLIKVLVAKSIATKNSGDAHIALQVAEEIVGLAIEIDDKKSLAEGYRLKGLSLLRLTTHSKALENFEKSLEIYQELDDKLAVIRLYNNIGLAYNLDFDYLNALLFFQKSLAISETERDKPGIANALNNIGTTYYLLSDFTKSLECYYDSIVISKEINDTLNISLNLNNIGKVHMALGQHTQALKFFLESLPIFEQNGDRYSQVIVLNNVGMELYELGDYGAANEFHHKGLSLAREIEYSFGESGALYFIGRIEVVKEKFEIAKEYFAESLRLADKDFEIEINRSLGALHAIEKFSGYNLKTAIQHLNIALGLATDLKNNLSIFEIHDALSTLYKSIGDYENAFEHYRLYHQVREEVLNEKQLLKLQHLQITYQVEQIKQENEIYRLKNVELVNALEEIKRLEDLVVMCAWTGRVQLDGKWVRIEEFLIKKFGIQVSHGISEEAAEKILNEVRQKKP
jgi:tetratricopeptide (TPR) repeat protein